MADHEQIDLTTLQEVERLLASTEFATADDLLGNGAAVPATRTAAARDRTLSTPPAGQDALPRRR